MESATLHTLQGIAAIAQILVAILALVVSAAITLLVHGGMKRSADMQYRRAVGNAWMEMDKFALANEHNLKVFVPS